MVTSATALTGHIYHQTRGNDVEILVTYYNPSSINAKGLSASAYIPDTYSRSPGFKVRSRESGRRFIYLNSQDVEPGYHPIIIRTMNDEGVREKRHSWVFIE